MVRIQRLIESCDGRMHRAVVTGFGGFAVLAKSLAKRSDYQSGKNSRDSVCDHWFLRFARLVRRSPISIP